MISNFISPKIKFNIVILNFLIMYYKLQQILTNKQGPNHNYIFNVLICISSFVLKLFFFLNQKILKTDLNFMKLCGTRQDGKQRIKTNFLKSQNKSRQILCFKIFSILIFLFPKLCGKKSNLLQIKYRQHNIAQNSSKLHKSTKSLQKGGGSHLSMKTI